MAQFTPSATLALPLYIYVLHEENNQKFVSIANSLDMGDHNLGVLRKKPASRPSVMAARRLREEARKLAHFPWPVDVELQIDAIDNHLLARDIRSVAMRYGFSARLAFESIKTLDGIEAASYEADDWGNALFAERYYAALVSSSSPVYNSPETREAYLTCLRVLTMMLNSLGKRWAAYLAMRKVSNITMMRWNQATTIAEKQSDEIRSLVASTRHFETLFACLELNPLDRDVTFNILATSSGLDRKDHFTKVCEVLGPKHRETLNSIVEENKKYLVNGDEINLQNWIDEMNAKPITHVTKKYLNSAASAACGAALLSIAAISSIAFADRSPLSEAPAGVTIQQYSDLKPLNHIT